MTATRTPVDVLLVSLGTTFGLRTADDQLTALLRAEGITVEVARPVPPREVRTLALTDLVQARACRAAAREALERVEPRALLYASTTAAMFGPRPGAIRFDALAQRTRPGHDGPWQRALERRRLRAAPLLLPWAEGSLEGAPAGAASHVVLPVALDPAQADAGVEQAVGALHDAAAVDGRRPVAITYAADPGKKGLTRTVAAFARVRHPEEVLLVAGLEALPPTIAGTEGVVAVGRLERPVFRALVRSVGTFVIAPRREDYGLVQLEALAEGARVVTTEAPGPYAALPVIRQLWPEQVVGADASDGELGRAIRSALDARPDPAEQLRATAAVEPWAPEQVRQILRERVIPQMLDGRPPS